MLKKEIAPGIIVYSDVIIDSHTLYNDIEEGMISAKIEWENARVKEGDNTNIVNTLTRNTSTIGIPYIGKIEELVSHTFSQEFYTTLNNLFFKNFDPIEKDYMSAYGIKTNWHDQYGILKYGKDQFFTNHIVDHPDFHRRISTIYYLIDNINRNRIAI